MWRSRFPATRFTSHIRPSTCSCSAKGGSRSGWARRSATQIEKRFGAEFDRPVARMTELVGALRAIFAAWNTGERLDFRGEYYRHTLMTPTFSPGAEPVRPAADLRRGAGPAADPGRPPRSPTACWSCRSARSGSCTRSTMPAVARGPGRGGPRRRDDFAVVPEIIVSVGSERARTTPPPASCWRSTGRRRPTGRCWTCTAGVTCSPSCTRCPSRAAGQEMGALIDDDVLHTIAACGTPAEVAAHIRDRVDGVADQICLYQPGPDRGRLVGADR